VEGESGGDTEEQAFRPEIQDYADRKGNQGIE
jgi:hypothetical protein